MPEIEPATPLALALLCGLGVIAGAVNTVAGAGSLLLLPALVFSGLPDDAANATNRIGVLAQTLMAVWGFRRAGLSVGAPEWRLSGMATIGGALGALVATLLSAGRMRIAILVAMAVMLVLSLMPRKKRAAPAGEAEAPMVGGRRPIEPTPLLAVGFLALGAYGGFLQAGFGILVLLFMTHASRTDLLTANVLKSTATLGLTIVAIGVFVWRGVAIDPVRGLALAAGSGLGGVVGARAAIALGERVVRTAVAIAVLAAMLRLLWDML